MHLQMDVIRKTETENVRGLATDFLTKYIHLTQQALGQFSKNHKSGSKKNWKILLGVLLKLKPLLIRNGLKSLTLQSSATVRLGEKVPYCGGLFYLTLWFF